MTIIIIFFFIEKYRKVYNIMILQYNNITILFYNNYIKYTSIFVKTGQISLSGYPVHEMSNFTKWMRHIVQH